MENGNDYLKVIANYLKLYLSDFKVFLKILNY